MLCLKNDTLAEIEDNFLRYVRSNYAADSCIIFDSYSSANKNDSSDSTPALAASISTKGSKRSHINVPFAHQAFLFSEKIKMDCQKCWH